MRCIAIDDEPIALEVVKSLAAKVPFIQLEACYTDAFAALHYLQQEKPDLVFLDIKMPDINRIDWLKALPDPPMIIFTTAYSDHALEGYELDIVDYLLKPFSLARFLKATTKAHELFQLINTPETSKPTDFIFIKSGYEQVRVDLSTLLYVQSAGNYLHFISADQKWLTRLTMNEAEELLPATHFIRIHRSYLVATSKITRMDRSTVWIDRVSLPVGAGYTEKIEKLNSI